MRLGAELGTKDFSKIDDPSNLSISLSIGEEAPDVRVIESAMKAWSL